MCLVGLQSALKIRNRKICSWEGCAQEPWGRGLWSSHMNVVNSEVGWMMSPHFFFFLSIIPWFFLPSSTSSSRFQSSETKEIGGRSHELWISLGRGSLYMYKTCPHSLIHYHQASWFFIPFARSVVVFPGDSVNPSTLPGGWLEISMVHIQNLNTKEKPRNEPRVPQLLHVHAGDLSKLSDSLTLVVNCVLTLDRGGVWSREKNDNELDLTKEQVWDDRHPYADVFCG